MPEQKPSSLIISRSYSVLSSKRLDSKKRDCSLKWPFCFSRSCWISQTAVFVVSLLLTKRLAG